MLAFVAASADAFTPAAAASANLAALAQLLVLLLGPWAALALARGRWLARIDPVVTCYALGILWANAAPLVGLRNAPALSLGLADIAVPLAIPLLLFGSDLARFGRQGRATLIAFFVAALTSTLASLAVGLAWAHSVPEGWAASGMLAALFIGGTANLMAVGHAIGASQSTIVLLNAADVVLGATYLLLLLTVWPRLVRAVLPRPAGAPPFAEPAAAPGSVRTWRQFAREAGAALGLAVALVGLAAAIAHLATGALDPTWLLVALTTLAVLASLSPRVRAWRAANELGSYAILAFSVALGSLTELSTLASATSELLALAATVLVLAVLGHLTVLVVLRALGVTIDADTAVISSVAAIFGPPFVPAVARVLDNRDALVGGILSGLAGYALGNYAGIAVALLLRPS